MLKVARYPVAMFVCLALLSPFSISPLGSFFAATKIAAIFAISTFVVLAFPRNTLRQVVTYGLVGLSCSALLMFLNVNQIINLDSLIGENSYRAVLYNRTVVVLALVSSTVITLLTSRHNASRSERVLSVLVGIVALILLMFMDSQSAVLYFISFALCYLLFRHFVWLIGISKWVIICLVFVAPMLAFLLANVLLMETGIDAIDRLIFVSNSMARIEIWNAFAAAALERPIVGWGLGTERLVHDIAANGTNQWLHLNHPHSLTIQVWVNLGLYGAILLSIGIFLLYNWIGEQAATVVPALAAQVASLFVVANISHGAWQSWWLAVLPIPFIVTYLRPDSTDDNANSN